MSSAKHTYILAAGLLAVMLSLAVPRASAQFSLDTGATTGGSGDPITSQMPSLMDKPTVKIDVQNVAAARAARKIRWKKLNLVDTKVSVAGTMTQYNKAWTTGNQNSISAEVSAYYYHTYAKDRHTSLFKFDMLYGVNYIDDEWFKNQDMFKLYYLSSWKIRTTGFWKDWAYSASTDFTSQFSRGFKSRDEPDVVWSNFLAPATWNLGAGITYTSPNLKLPFIVTLNPISANAVFVADAAIDDERRRSLGILVPGTGGAGVFDHRGMVHKIEGGSNLNVAFNRTFTFGKRQGILLQYNTTLSSFYGWITQVSHHDRALPEIMPTFTWTSTISFNPIRFVLIEFRTVAKYDHSQIAEGQTKAKLQMQYYLRVGLTYRFLNR